ncbi:MAG TPA: hypothetical protein VL147_14880 [Devosia sp.]|nr:hypothetical protein [Devosia sp.]
MEAVFRCCKNLSRKSDFHLTFATEIPLKYLNTPRPQNRTILAPPFISPVQVPSPRGGRRRAFPRQALDELMAKLVAKASQEQTDGGEYPAQCRVGE